jgi:DNA-binding transcriptional MerR regulator
MAELTIRQVAEQTGLSTHTLRYYEREGLITPVGRATNGHRRYTQDDVYGIVFVTRLRASGMTISDIKRYVDLAQLGSSTTAERLALLESHRDHVRERLEEINQHLQVIEDKIEHYRALHEPLLKELER